MQARCAIFNLVLLVLARSGVQEKKKGPGKQRDS